MDGFNKTATGSPGGVSFAWQMAGMGDFDRDGRVDILWRRPGVGSNIIWLMDGTLRKAGSGPIASAPPDWLVKGVKDYNGDGAADILWYNTRTSLSVIWQMNGRIKQDAKGIGKPGLVWQIEN